MLKDRVVISCKSRNLERLRKPVSFSIPEHKIWLLFSQYYCLLVMGRHSIRKDREGMLLYHSGMEMRERGRATARGARSTRGFSPARLPPVRSDWRSRLFSRFGTVVDVYIPAGTKNRNRFFKYAFIRYRHEKEMWEAINKGNRRRVEGLLLVVKKVAFGWDTRGRQASSSRLRRHAESPGHRRSTPFKDSRSYKEVVCDGASGEVRLNLLIGQGKSAVNDSEEGADACRRHYEGNQMNAVEGAPPPPLVIDILHQGAGVLRLSHCVVVTASKQVQVVLIRKGLLALGIECKVCQMGGALAILKFG